MILHSGLKT